MSNCFDLIVYTRRKKNKMIKLFENKKQDKKKKDTKGRHKNNRKIQRDIK